MKLLVNGARGMADVPGLDAASAHVDIAFAPDEEQLGLLLEGSDILLGWDFRGRDLRNQWGHANQLKWIHWCGAGVDAVLFPELVASTTVLTNARGIFDRAMAEYVLGYMLAETKGFRDTWAFQAEKTWDFRMTDKLCGSRAVVFGVGSIGREIGRLLKAMGVDVVGVGRRHRLGDPDFGEVYSQAVCLNVLSDADWVIGVMPLTEQTQAYFDARFFGMMKPTARFINVGRGPSVVETDLRTSLIDGQIAGAMLDVFEKEPLAEASQLWETPNLVISPHMSGDYAASKIDLVKQFLENLERFILGQDLINVVNKELGFVHADQT